MLAENNPMSTEASKLAVERSENEPPARATGPGVMVIFGATGDLTSRKLIPALYNLVAGNLLSREFAMVGVGRAEMTVDVFRQQMSVQLQRFATGQLSKDLCEWLVRRMYYVAGDFTAPATYEKLGQCLAQVDKNHTTHGNYIFYLATAPSAFGTIVSLLGQSGLAAEKDGQWRRVVIEKPFGEDLESAKALNRSIKSVLAERQIYRIDHYLGKETVQNILVFRS